MNQENSCPQAKEEDWEWSEGDMSQRKETSEEGSEEDLDGQDK